MVLSHVLEHNYLVKGDDDKVRLGGVVVGLALNSVYYFQTIKYGATYEQKIDHNKLVAEGQRMAAEVVKRMRNIDGLKDIPITIALFEQQSKASVIPGNFIAYSQVSKGSSSLGDWENVDEKYYLFPSGDAKSDHRDDMTNFENFKQDVETSFPNFNGVIGKAFYVGNQFHQISIDIPIQFYGKAEGVGFTQYVTGLVMKYFPDYVSVQVNIYSVSGQEAIIIRNADQAEPVVHIYQ